MVFPSWKWQRGSAFNRHIHFLIGSFIAYEIGTAVCDKRKNFHGKLYDYAK